MTQKPRTCPDCDYFSPAHHSCFHPATWTPGDYFKIPGDPLVWNPGGRCKMFEPMKSYPTVRLAEHRQGRGRTFHMLKTAIGNFLRRFRRSK